MGGESSSYYAILSIVGFFSAIWSASKFSSMIGISSIVFEIATGLVFSPGVLGLMPTEYAECYHAKVTNCKTWADQARIAEKGDEYCDVQAYTEEGTCDVAEYCGVGVRRLSAGTSDLTVVDVMPRHLGGGGGEAKYDSYSECLERSCDMDLKAHCSMTPDVFTLLGHTGVAMMIFESGMHFDFDKAKVVGPWACVVAVLGTGLPLLGGWLCIVLFGLPSFPDGVAAGTALAPTSVGIALRLLHEAQRLQSDFGQAIITAAFVDDILSLILFNILFSLGDSEISFMGTFFKPLMGVLFMIITVFLATDKFPSLVQKILARFEGKESGPKESQVLFFIMVVVLVAYAQITHLCGTHLWGCFIAGMSFVCVPSAHRVWVRQTKRFTAWMIRIFFAATVAFAIPLEELGDPENILRGAIMGIGPCILTKVCCAFFMGEPRFVIGWAMVGRAEFAYLIAQMAQASGMMEPETFSIVIWALLWATIFAPFVFRTVLNRYSQKLAALEGTVAAGGPPPGRRSSRTSQMSNVVPKGNEIYNEEEAHLAQIEKLTLALEVKQYEIDMLYKQKNVKPADAHDEAACETRGMVNDLEAEETVAI